MGCLETGLSLDSAQPLSLKGLDSLVFCQTEMSTHSGASARAPSCPFCPLSQDPGVMGTPGTFICCLFSEKKGHTSSHSPVLLSAKKPHSAIFSQGLPLWLISLPRRGMFLPALPHHKGSSLTFSTLLRVGSGGRRMCEKAVPAQIRDLAWAVSPECEAGIKSAYAAFPPPVSRRAKARVGDLTHPGWDRHATGELSPGRVSTCILC